MYSTLHYDTGTGRAACGKGGRSPRLTTAVVGVCCGHCERNATFRAAHGEYWAARLDAEAQRAAEVTAAGFDPTMKLGDMTPEQVEAFAAWLNRDKEAS